MAVLPTPGLVNAGAIAFYLPLLLAAKVITPAEVRVLAQTFVRRQARDEE